MEKFLLLSLSSSLFFLLQFQTLTLVLSLTPDGLSLLALKAAVDSFPGDTFSDWNENDTNPCHWSGIACMNIAGDSNPRVVGITVSGRNLHGYIPSELGALLYLRRLNLHGNNFTGSIPSQLFNASSLHSIFLYDNDLTGKFPGEICKIPRLQNLDLSRNSLSGELPTGISNCRQLQRLILHDNFFTGKIPSGIGSLKNLVQLDLSANRLNGTIPSELGQLDSLSGTLNLSFNHFSGEIPKSLSKLPITVSFDLRHNNLTGQIPQEGSFENQGPTAFLNNPLLCGFPLQTPCRNSTPGSPDIQIPVPVSGNPGKKRLKPGVIIAISFADAAGVAIIGLILVFLYWKTKDNRSCSCTTKGQLGGKDKFGISNCFCRKGSDPGEMSETGSEKGAEGDLVTMDKGFNFDLDELLRASAYVLGKSGLGIVYKVVLGNGIPVAVRRLGEGGTQRYKEFTAEIQAIGRIRHPNIVKLRAYYWAPDEKLLICDFISNGNLGSALHGRTGQASAKLSWSTRLKIAKGTACGLAHLHECSPRKFVHGDIKPSNILLDSNYQPYISDFGLNRLVSIAGSSPSSSNSGGFIGGAFPYGKQIQANGASTSKPSGIHYRAPEARVAGNRPTQKWDVYSFGVVLLELLTGKSPEYQYPAGDGDLVMWVRKGFEEENPLSEMVDPALLQEVHAKKEVIGVFHVALACTDDDPENRPRMKTASENLERIGA